MSHRTVALRRLRQCEGHAGEPRPTPAFGARWLQPNGFQLALRSAPLSARSGCAARSDETGGARKGGSRFWWHAGAARLPGVRAVEIVVACDSASESNCAELLLPCAVPLTRTASVSSAGSETAAAAARRSSNEPVPIRPLPQLVRRNHRFRTAEARSRRPRAPANAGRSRTGEARPAPSRHPR
jgi:hypothetical protein